MKTIKEYQIKESILNNLKLYLDIKDRGDVDKYLNASDFENFIINTQQELDGRLRKNINPTIDLVDCLYYFGLLLCETGQADTGLEYLYEALKQIKILLKRHELVSLYNRKLDVINLLTKWTDFNEQRVLFAETVHISFRLCSIDSSEESKDRLASSLHDFADLFYNSMPHSGSKLLELCVTIRKEIAESQNTLKSKNLYIGSLSTLALHLWWKDKNYKKAEELFKQALHEQLSISIEDMNSNYQLEITSILTCLAQIKRDQNRFTEAKHLETIIDFFKNE